MRFSTRPPTYRLQALKHGSIEDLRRVLSVARESGEAFQGYFATVAKADFGPLAEFPHKDHPVNVLECRFFCETEEFRWRWTRPFRDGSRQDCFHIVLAGRHWPDLPGFQTASAEAEPTPRGQAVSWFKELPIRLEIPNHPGKRPCLLLRAWRQGGRIVYEQWSGIGHIHESEGA